MCEKLCSRRMRKNDISLYANCVEAASAKRGQLRAPAGGNAACARRPRRTCRPRQMRGPALNGRKMNLFAVKYLFRRSSRNRSGSNSSAVPRPVSSRVVSCAHSDRALTVRAPVVLPTMHQEDGVCNAAPGCKRKLEGSGCSGDTYATSLGTNTGGFVGSGFGMVVSRLATLRPR